MDTLIYASATELAAAIRARKLSSLEVVQACLQRIEQVNPRLNAVVHLAADSAQEQARKADAALARGEIMGPLHGVPITVKDSFDAAGMVSTWGTPGRAGHVPAQDATAVARLKAAGAIVLGKTNTPEFTYSYETDNPVYGLTLNPYDLERSPGGSSGGAAAIVACGGSPLDVGSDTGGSIRLPAHFCGIAGIKPTSGRVPRTGHAIAFGGLLDAFTQIGPLARYVEDLALVLPLLAGPDGQDPSIAPVPLGDSTAVDLPRLRGAYYTDNGIQTPTSEVIQATRAAVKALMDMGIAFDEARPPGTEESLELYATLLRGWDGGARVRLLLERAGTALDVTSLGRFLAAPSLPAAELVLLIDRWDRFRTRMLVFLERYDIIVAPVNAYAALPHGQLGTMYPGFSYTMAYNLTGWPGAVVRVGTSPEGLPIGVQVLAHPWREDVALAAAAALERALGGWQPPPRFE